MSEDSEDSDCLSRTIDEYERTIQEEDFKRAGYQSKYGVTIEESSEQSGDDDVIDDSFEETNFTPSARSTTFNNITNLNGNRNNIKPKANRIDSSDDESADEVESAASRRKNTAAKTERTLHRRLKPIIDSDSSDEETEPPRIASSSEDDSSVNRTGERPPNKSISSANGKLNSQHEENITHRRRVPVIESDSSEEETEPQVIESSSEDDAVISNVEGRRSDRSVGVTKALSDTLHIDLTESTDEDDGGKGDSASVPRRVEPPRAKRDTPSVPRKVEPPSAKRDTPSVPPKVEPPSGKRDIALPRKVEPPIAKRDAPSLPVKVEPLVALQRPGLQAAPSGTGASSTQTSGLTDYFNMAFENQKRSFEFKINSKRNEMDQVKRAISSVNLRDLPDGGSKMMARIAYLQKELRALEQELASLAARHNATTDTFRPPVNQGNQVKPSALWKNLKQTNDIQHGFGAKAMENHLAERALTLDALRTLHKSIKTCPGEETFSEDPTSLRSSVTLMPHQKQALAWLAWREQQKPPGGILADDMGLGKTLTMISLVLKQMEDGAAGDDDDDDDVDNDEEKPKDWLSKSKQKSVKGGTLVVCPASLLSQWAGEVKARVKKGVLDVEIHHGGSRETKPHRLARKDIVITTYAIVRTEGERKGALHQVRWGRIILDEAHVVRNYKSKTSVAVVALQGKHRWALTGTPIHNKELDLFALIKFLRCTPFDELAVWRRWVDNKRENGMERLNTLLNSMMLRRTKELLQATKALNCLPTKELHEIEVKLHAAEMAVYEKILEYSRNLFSQFLNQRAEKEAVANGTSASYQPVNFKNMKQSENPFDPKSKLGVLVNRYTSMEDVKSHQILVLLLRLRQICCHTGLIKAMLDEEEAVGEDGIEDTSGVDVDLMDQIAKMSLGDKDNGKKDDEEDKDDVTKILSMKNEVFDMDRVSSKIEAVFKVLDERVLCTSDKAVVVSQWASMLHIMRDHLLAKGVRIVLLTGAVPVKDRTPIIEQFNLVGRGPQVMLLSLTAGGVGLNLIGGNHLFLCDLHWNPQLEAQACDRIFRVGQKKGVHIYKFVCESTIEQRIKALQDQKMQIAVNVLTGARNTSANKLSMNDLKMLFEIA